MENTTRNPESIVPYVLAGTWGLAGLALLAFGSHALTDLAGGEALILHASAVMGVANQTRFGGAYKRAALALLLAGSGLMALAGLLHANISAATLGPVGIGMAALGWLCIPIGALRAQKT